MEAKKYQARWVIFCKKNGYRLDANNSAEYMAWITLMAGVFKLENRTPHIADHQKFTRFLKSRSCGKNF